MLVVSDPVAWRPLITSSWIASCVLLYWEWEWVQVKVVHSTTSVRSVRNANKLIIVPPPTDRSLPGFYTRLTPALLHTLLRWERATYIQTDIINIVVNPSSCMGTPSLTRASSKTKHVLVVCHSQINSSSFLGWLPSFAEASSCWTLTSATYFGFFFHVLVSLDLHFFAWIYIMVCYLALKTGHVYWVYACVRMYVSVLLTCIIAW